MEKIKMIKKFLTCVLCMMMILTPAVSATGTESTTPSESAAPEQTVPQQGEGRMGGGRGGMGGMAPGGERPQMPEGGMTPPEGEIPQMPEGEFTLPEEMQQGTGKSQPTETLQSPDNREAGMSGQDVGRGQWQQSDGTHAESGQNTHVTTAGFLKEYQTPVIAAVLLILAFVFVKFYKKKNY